MILSPETIFKFHRMLKNKKYQALFSQKVSSKNPGPKGPSKAVINAIVEMKKRNLRMGCPKIALTISNTFGIKIDKNVVRRVLKKYYQPSPLDHGGMSWLSFLGNLKDSLWSLDLFRVESISLKTHWVMVVMDQYSRRIVGFSAVGRDYLSGADVCIMLNKVLSSCPLPRRISTDHDPLFTYFQWKANLRVNEIEEVKTIPFTPISHPFVERVIGTTRREYLDHVFFMNAADLENKLNEFKRYYNESRHHLSLGCTPKEKANAKRRKVANIGNFLWESYCEGLFQAPCAV